MAKLYKYLLIIVLWEICHIFYHLLKPITYCVTQHRETNPNRIKTKTNVKTKYYIYKVLFLFLTLTVFHIFCHIVINELVFLNFIFSHTTLLECSFTFMIININILIIWQYLASFKMPRGHKFMLANIFN